MLYNLNLIEAARLLKQKAQRATESVARADAEELAAKFNAEQAGTEVKEVRSGFRKAADHDAFMLRAAAIDFVREWEEARMPQLHELLGRRTDTQPAATAAGA